MLFPRKLVSLSIAIALSLGSAAILADEYDELDELEDDLADFYGDEDFISLATGSKKLIHKAPSVATVITAEEIVNTGAMDLDDVLEMVPGLHVSKLPNVYLSIYTFRGIYSSFNPQVLMLINGIPVTNVFTGNRSQLWGGMPVHAIERVEVIRGPGSAIYGADAFSGVINVITKTSENIEKNTVGFRAGSYDTTDFWFSHGGKLGNVATSLIVEVHKTDGHDEIIQSDAQTILDAVFGTNASLAPGSVNNKRDNLDLRLDLAFEKWKLRGGLQSRELGAGVGIAEALDPTSVQSSNRWNIDLTYKNDELAKDWNIEALLSHLNTTQEIDNNLIIFPPGADIGFGAPFPDGVIGNPEVFEKHSRLNFTTSYKGLDSHELRIGIGHNYSDLYKVKESKNFAFGPNGEFLVPGSPVVDVSDTPFVFLTEGDRKNNYFFVQDIWAFANDWELTAGIRYDDYSDFGSTTNPRLALVWSSSLNLTTKFLYGKAFRAPSFAETRNINNPVALGNPNLSPERIETFELVMDYHPQTGFSSGVSFFYHEWNEIIQFVPDTGATSNTAQNIGEQTGYGVEIEFEWEATEHFKLKGNYSIQRSTDELTKQDIAFVPQQQLFLQADWQLEKSWHMNTKFNWVMDRERAQIDTRSAIDDYQIVDVTIRWQAPESNLSLALIARNLFDEDAREPTANSGPIANIPFDLPLAGSNFFAEISYVF
ncbi:TonB-dependent receptor plug domain-containing protein [Aliikangiella coralliicola]|uniref:TonB-dependent receptor n=1 Tax=Aliikangiella coralliicola TaxID=2592383 RepID=A0A545U518_9GAMM|nr:TonB-dependent receptor [Aliikangiella coralliicola]TQV84565.1 TonB-dependent receptor [Aliikangiella coralliicola]